MDIESVLLSWGFPDLIELFQENEINLTNLKNITPDLARELIPKIGPRMEFMAKVEAYKETIKITKMPNSGDIDKQNEESQELLDIYELPNSGHIDKPNEESQELLDITNSSIVLPNENRDISFIGIDYFFCKPKFPDFDLRTLLDTKPLGSAIIKFYKSNNQLDHTRRTWLVDIIMKHIFLFITKHRLKHEDYNLISSKIINLFPTECVGTYYVPSIKKADSPCGRTILARGKLVDKYRNMLYISGEVQSRKRKKSHLSKENDNPSFNICDLDITFDDPHLIEQKMWLKHRSEPWSEVLQKWQESFSLRQKSKAQTLSEFYLEWPILRDHRAATLIDLDFDRLYSQKSILLKLRWQFFFEKILKLRKDSVTDVSGINLLSILSEGDIEEHSDQRFCVQLSVLPYLVPPKGRIIVAKRHWKFSILECLESLILHVKTPGDIEEQMRRIKTQASCQRDTIQPYILVEGSSLDKINNSYVVVDDLKYQFDSPLAAFDLCFKLFHTLHGEYPKQSEHIYTLIQKCIYNISIPKLDKTFPYIMDIINSFQNSDY